MGMKRSDETNKKPAQTRTAAPDPIKMKYFEAEMVPFGNTFEERLAHIRKIGKEASKDFQPKYAAIQDWFKRYDQLSILSFAYYYFMLSEAGYDEEAVTGTLEFPQYYQELLQAFALTLPRGFDHTPFSEEVFKFKEDFRKIGELNRMKYYDIPEAVSTIQELFSHEIRSEMMLHTTAVRNWSYEHKMKAVTEALASAVKEDFITVHGFDPCLLLKIMEKMGEEIEQRANRHRLKTVQMVQAATSDEIFKAYESCFDVKKTSREEKEQILKLIGKDPARIKPMLLMHSDTFLKGIFSFDFSEIAALADHAMSAQELKDMFKTISYEFGDLAGHDPEHFLLGNPVHEKPFIKIDENTIFSTMWSVTTHLSISILEKFCAEDAKLRKKYNEARAVYLENQVQLLFETSFPSAQIYPASKWKGKDGRIYENDLLVIIDSFAIIVEAKSGQISAPAKRGAPDRLFKTLQQLIEEPSDQALRFIAFLKDNPSELKLEVKNGKYNKFNAAGLKYFIPLGVTLAHLGFMGSNLKHLIQAGVTARKIEELAPSINLTDLECVFDLLPLASQKLHYLQRRREIEADINYMGDELDLLAWYLEEGFNFGPDYDRYNFFNVSLKAKELDNYFIGTANNEKVVKPELQMTQWWKDILQRAESRQFQQWMESSYIMLNVPISGQNYFEKQIEDLKEEILQGKAKFEHNYILLRSQEEKRRFYMAGYFYNEKYADQRNDVIEEILHLESVHDGKGMLVISMNIDKKHYPYSVLGSRLSIELFDSRYLKMTAAGENEPEKSNTEKN